jgi:hypothetical protein
LALEQYNTYDYIMHFPHAIAYITLYISSLSSRSQLVAAKFAGENYTDTNRERILSSVLFTGFSPVLITAIEFSFLFIFFYWKAIISHDEGLLAKDNAHPYKSASYNSLFSRDNEDQLVCQSYCREFDFTLHTISMFRRQANMIVHDIARTTIF